MLEIVFLAAHLFVMCAAGYLMIAAYAVLWDNLTPLQGLLWLPYKPCEWIWSVVSKPTSAPSGAPAGPSEPTVSFTAAELAALKKLATDVEADVATVFRGGLRPLPPVPKPAEAAPVVSDAAPPAGRIPA
jgi:hypothetical protein